jgi:hypothetical protein
MSFRSRPPSRATVIAGDSHASHGASAMPSEAPPVAYKATSKRKRSIEKTSGYRGVTAASESSDRVAWRARIRFGKFVVNLGR